MALGEDDSNLFGCDCPSGFDQRPDNGIVITIFGRQDIAFVGVLPALYPSDVRPAPPPRARGSTPCRPAPGAPSRPPAPRSASSDRRADNRERSCPRPAAVAWPRMPAPHTRADHGTEAG